MLPRKKVFFSKKIPEQVKYDIDTAIQQTAEDGKEKSIAFCKIKGKDRLFTGSYSRGEFGQVEIKPCEKRFGDATKVGNFHTHPPSENVVGLTPSENDLYEGLAESREYRVRQVSCISNDKSKMVHCFQPARPPTEEQLTDYEKSMKRMYTSGYDTDPYLSNNVHRDFNHAWYDRKTGRRIPHPKAKRVVDDAIGKSTRNLRYNIQDMDKGEFCDLIQDYNLPQRDDVGIECRKELRRRKILGLEF